MTGRPAKPAPAVAERVAKGSPAGRPAVDRAVSGTVRERRLESGPPVSDAAPPEPQVIGPARAVPVATPRPVGVLRQVSGYPIQPSKVQRPPLRDDVLSRPRLNDQLEAKSSHRVVLLVAEAGYGKTTLLADWTRRTARRVLWYRLDGVVDGARQSCRS